MEYGSDLKFQLSNLKFEMREMQEYAFMLGEASGRGSSAVIRGWRAGAFGFVRGRAPFC